MRLIENPINQAFCWTTGISQSCSELSFSSETANQLSVWIKNWISYLSHNSSEAARDPVISDRGFVRLLNKLRKLKAKKNYAIIFDHVHYSLVVYMESWHDKSLHILLSHHDGQFLCNFSRNKRTIHGWPWYSPSKL